MNGRLESILSIIRKNHPTKVRESYIDTLPEAASEFTHVEASEETSAHAYPPDLVELIEEAKDEWILDCGSGARSRAYNKLINYEIHPFNGVDVVGVAERLPFEDDTFELIISLSVLEHVRNPFIAVSELQRVLKPGGLLWIDTAFMQPYHAYPAHYYNMTQQGLENLLADNLEIVRDTVPRYGTPIWSLSWILNQYANNLPEQTREEFLNLKVSELTQSPEILCRKRYSEDLPEKARKELAATISILAKKKHSR